MACKCGAAAVVGRCPSCGAAPTAESFLELWRRILPSSYVDPIEHEDGGVGFDVPTAQAEIFACLSDAMETNVGASYLRRWSGASKPWASGPKKATATIVVSRATGIGRLPLRAGTALLAVATDSFGAKQALARFLLTSDVVLEDGDIGPVDADVEAEFPGYASNVVAGSIVEFWPLGTRAVAATVSSVDGLTIDLSGDGDDFSGTSGRLFVLDGALSSQNRSVPRETLTSGSGAITFDPPLDIADIGASVTVRFVELSELGLELEQPECASGGASGSLDAIAAERGAGRGPQESDESFSRRIEEAPERVSPVAIESILDCELGACGIGWKMDEVGVGLGFALDHHASDTGSLEESGYGHGAVLVDRPSRYYVVTVWVPDAIQFAYGMDGGGPYPSVPDSEESPPLDGGIDYPGIECVGAAYEALRPATMAGVKFEFRKAET